MLGIMTCRKSKLFLDRVIYERRGAIWVCRKRGYGSINVKFSRVALSRELKSLLTAVPVDLC